MFREDYLIRLIQQVAEALRRIMGLRQRGDYQAALTACGELYDDLTTVPREISDSLDSHTFADLLGTADKIRALALLFWEEARIHEATGDPLAARALYVRAHELFLEARARASAGPEDESAILELSRFAPARDLAPRYRAGA